jgi:hypothetical protein
VSEKVSRLDRLPLPFLCVSSASSRKRPSAREEHARAG